MTHFNHKFKNWTIVSLFVALAAIGVKDYTPSTFDNVKDIWNLPARLTAIEADIVEINEMIRFIEDGDRIITSASE